MIIPILNYKLEINFQHKYWPKKTWITISILIDIVTVLFLGIWSLPLVLLITMMFVNSTDSAIRDVAVDGIMCVEGKKRHITGKIQAIQWISITFAAIITGLAGGYIADHFDYRIGFLGLIPFYILMFVPIYFYKEKTPKRKPVQWTQILTPYKKILKHKSFLWACLFLFLYKFSPSFGTPLSYIQRDSFQWSYQFMGVLETIASILSIVGAFIYFKISKKINIKKWLYISVFLGALISLSYLYYTPITAVAYLALYSFIGMGIHLMILDWMAKSSINGLEATTFALLCGINNLSAGTASSFSGAFLYPIVGLSWLIILSAITSFMCLPIIKKLNLK